MTNPAERSREEKGYGNLGNALQSLGVGDLIALIDDIKSDYKIAKEMCDRSNENLASSIIVWEISKQP